MMSTSIREQLLRLCFGLIRRLQSDPPHAVQCGDVVWCRMPLSEERLRQIPAGHQIRPYVVCQVHAQGIRAYACSSHAFHRVNEAKVCRIIGASYGIGKDTYVNTSRMWEIPDGSICQYYFHLDQEDIARIRRCRDARPAVRAIGVGSMVRHQHAVYYIYGARQGAFLALPMQKSESGQGPLFSYHSALYRIDFSQTIRLDEDMPLQLLQQFSLSQISQIAKCRRQAQLARQRQPGMQREREAYRFVHPVGQMFSLGGTICFVYLFSIGHHAYGLRLDEEGCSDYRLHREKRMAYLKAEEACGLEDLQEALDIMLEEEAIGEYAVRLLLHQRRLAQDREEESG